MEIKTIKPNNEEFEKICDYIEENITKHNLRKNGGTLNYNKLTYQSDILIIAEENNIPIGYNSIIRYKNGYYIYQIAVKKEYQNKRVGTQMMKKIIDQANEENTFVTAHVMNYNTNSQKLFLGLGFTKLGEDPLTGNGFYALEQKEIKNEKRRNHG